MKPRHNKKRNTSFLFEALVRNLTQAVLTEDSGRSIKIKKIIKHHFGKNSVLGKELGCYSAILESRDLDKYTAEKMIFRAKKEREGLGEENIFQSQSALIKEINQTIGANVYKTFVPNYKSLATVAQLFGNTTPVKDKVLLEKQVLEHMISSTDSSEAKMRPQDDLVITAFQKRFNEKYDSLLPEQKELLNRYVLSFGEEEANFKVYVAHTLQSIEEQVKRSLDLPEVLDDETMVENTHRVLEVISSYDVNTLTSNDVLQVVKLQELVKEYQPDAS